MAKVKVMDSARELEARAKQLFERIKGMNADMSATLEDMRQYEGKLIEKEKIAEKERAEALRIERLRELANSADTAAYHSDEPETAEPEKPTTKPTIDELAQEVLTGKWGNGGERKNHLEAAGHDYAAVQRRVNEILSGNAPGEPTTPPTSEELTAAELDGKRLFPDKTLPGKENGPQS